MNYTLHCGDAITVLRTLPASSVQMVCTSPPYFGLRDYGTATWEGGDPACDHKQVSDNFKQALTSTLGGSKRNVGNALAGFGSTCGKCGARRVDDQIGLEESPDLYVAKLVDVFREVRRLLHPTGQVFINIGDSRSDSREWLGIPHRLVFALQADGWRWEDEVLWAKSNPMPGSQTNRFTRAHEYVFMLNKSRDAFFDSEAVKEKQNEPVRTRAHFRGGDKYTHDNAFNNSAERVPLSTEDGEPRMGRIRRSVWSIATEPTPMAHFATMPTKLVEPCILAGSSQYGACSKCLAPWERVVEREAERYNEREGIAQRLRNQGATNGGTERVTLGVTEYVKRTTTGWAATCQCQADVIPCTVLDPFAGAGTTLLVANRFGRRAIGIDLNAEYIKLATERLERSQPMLTGLFL